MEHRVTVSLRWRDIDIFGHVNQSIYHNFLEEARAGLIVALAERVGIGRERAGFVVRHVELDFHHEIRREDEHVEVIATVDRIGTSSVHLRHEVRLPDGTLAASGAAVLVGWDPQARVKRDVTDAERAVLTGAPAD